MDPLRGWLSRSQILLIDFCLKSHSLFIQGLHSDVERLSVKFLISVRKDFPCSSSEKFSELIELYSERSE